MDLLYEKIQQITEEVMLSNLPEGVTLLSKDWQGETKRISMEFTVSNQACNNPKFSLQTFLKKKFDNALRVVRHIENIENLWITHRLDMDVDPMNSDESTKFFIHIECKTDTTNN